MLCGLSRGLALGADLSASSEPTAGRSPDADREPRPQGHRYWGNGPSVPRFPHLRKGVMCSLRGLLRGLKETIQAKHTQLPPWRERRS